MYENAQPELDRILALVKTCPQDLQAKCFEVLLQGYVESQVPRRAAPETSKLTENGKDKKTEQTGDGEAGDIPAAIRNRFNSLATRSKVTPEQLAGLFDFTVEPFTFGPFAVEGKNSSVKARKVALVVAAKSYLVTGRWSADWDEVKAVCSDHGCYDTGNFAKTMRESKGAILKTVNVGESVELSPKGIEQAQTLVSEIVTNAAK